MFNSLKEKLKSWIKKTEESVEEVAEKRPKKKKSSKKPIKKEIKKAPKDIIEKDIEEVVTKEKKSLFSSLQKKLSEEKFEELFNELELILLQNNVAYEAVESIKDSLEDKMVGKNLKEVNLSEGLKDSIEDLLISPPNFIKEIKGSLKEKSPYVILFSGINGSGKTTTVAKIAKLLQKLCGFEYIPGKCFEALMFCTFETIVNMR